MIKMPFTFKKKWLQGGHVVLAAFLAFILFAMVNYLVSRHYQRIDFTASQMHTLSDKTKAVLSELTEPLLITVFYQPNHALYERIYTLLKEYEKSSPKLEIDYIDPQRDVARAQTLANRYQIDTMDVVIFDFKGRSKYLKDDEIANIDRTGYLQGIPPSIKAFKAEEAFTSAILSVTQERNLKVGWVTGHGEKDPQGSETSGVLQAVNLLTQDNLEVIPFSLLAQEKLSLTDYECVVVVGPTRRFTEAEIALLEVYLQEGGALLALLDPLVDSGVERVVSQWGIEIGSDVVVDPSQKLPYVSAANVFISNYSAHQITDHLNGVAVILPLARSVGRAEEIPEDVAVRTIAATTQHGWGETQLDDTTFVFDAESDKKGPVSVVATAQGDRSRVVVIGDSDFLTNSQIHNLGNADLFLNSVNWLLSRENLISISPKVPEDQSLNLTEGQMARAFWQNVLGLPFLGLVLGGTVWWRRRK
jgi:ABC-type uncharacterized transport system involved in gliding motility auxiliary subunit